MLVKIILLLLAGTMAIVVLTEIGLRSIFGFGNPLIYIKDPDIGYLLAPSQRVRRMGNRIEIDRYSMRGESFPEVRSTTSLRIMFLGDSIINGGWWTDRDHTIPVMVKTLLPTKVNLTNTYDKIESLNASANSWGPRNELAYLRRFGLFDAQILVLVINTDDLFATVPTSAPIGRDRNYPDRQPNSALSELWWRFLLDRNNSATTELQTADEGKANKYARSTRDRVGFNLNAIDDIATIAQQKNSRFLLVMTPLLREIKELGSRDYEVEARKRLYDFTQAEAITYIDFLPLLKQSQSPQSLYRDTIHFNERGNRFISEHLCQYLQPLLSESN